MAVALVGLGVLRPTFQILLDAVIAVRQETTMFKPLLGEIKSKLDSLQLLMKEMEEHNPNNPGLENFIPEIEEGVNLVHKCRKVGRWDCRKKYKCTNKLQELNRSLERLLDVLKVQGIRNAKETLVSLKNIEMSLGRIEENLAMENQWESKVIGWTDSAAPEAPRVTFGLDAPLKELKMKFFKDGESMLVVSAGGGFGKTTLAKMFCQDHEVKEKFKNNIIFVTLSQNPNLDVIVRQLYEHKGSKFPAFQNEAVYWLQQFLKERGQTPLLFVLDDVWSESESVVDKFDQFKMPKHKILVTSRFGLITRHGSPYHLEPLNEKDSMALFLHSASLEDKMSSYTAPQDLSKKIVKRCKGFPLAIKLVGRSLCGQPIEIWKKKVMEWSKGSSSVLASNQDLVHCLKRSLDDLDKEKPIIKQCFLDLCAFPSDQQISVAALMDMWAQLYDLDEHRSIAILHELINWNLFHLLVTRDETEADGYYAEHFVSQHEMLRDLALDQANQEPIEQRKRLFMDISGGNLPKWCTEQKHQPSQARLLSISTDGVIPEKWPKMQLPNGEVLALNFQANNYALPDFIKKMDKLTVLIVTNNDIVPADLENFESLDSLSNLKCMRLEHISISSISKKHIQLKSLQKMSFFFCDIGSTQILASMPNLVELNIDYCNDLVELPTELCDLVPLQKLSVTNCHKLSALPDEIGNLVNLESLRLRSCTELLELPSSIRNLNKLKFLDMSDCFSIKELPENIGELRGLEKLNMRWCSRLQELPASVSDLEKLKVVVCDEETEILWGPFKECLKNIHVKVVKEDVNLKWLHKLPS